MSNFLIDYITSANGLNIATSTPTSSSDTGTVGDVAWDSDYIYICTATNAWKRLSIATWGATDPNFSSVSLLLHMDGSNGSTTFTDSSSNAFTATRYGAVSVSTTQSKFGGASAAYSGGTTTDAIDYADNAAFVFGTGDFTLEAWAYINGTPSNVNALVAKYGSGGNEWIWWINSSGKLVFYTDGGSVTSSASVPTGQWTFLAATRSSGTVKLWIDGSEEASGTLATNFSGSAKLSVGNYPAFGNYNHGYGIAVDGYLDEVRITKTARYTANFTPPTAAFPDA